MEQRLFGGDASLKGDFFYSTFLWLHTFVLNTLANFQ